MYYVDFGMDEVGSFGEFDGKGKYLDEAMRSGRSRALGRRLESFGISPP